MLFINAFFSKLVTETTPRPIIKIKKKLIIVPYTYEDHLEPIVYQNSFLQNI